MSDKINHVLKPSKVKIKNKLKNGNENENETSFSDFNAEKLNEFNNTTNEDKDVLKKFLKSKKNKLKDNEQSTSSSFPNLYQKFVTGFDAILQNLVSEEQLIKSILSSFNIEGIATYINEKKPSNVIFMVGAGISTSAGIPDFRTAGTGLYDNLTKFKLPDPQAVFSINFFKEDPEPFYTLARKLFNDNVHPTLSHYLIRLFDKKKMLRRCYTQNIDSLEYAAGVSENRIVTAHGSYQTTTCQKSSCKKKYTKEWLIERLRDKNQIVPKCEACLSVVKPDITFFGETLSNRFFSLALADFPKCDLLIIMGTSLVVQPFASLIHQVPNNIPRLLINLNDAGQKSNGIFGESGSLKYAQNKNTRDVFWRGTCDEGSLKLARLLCFEDELVHLAKKK